MSTTTRKTRAQSVADSYRWVSPEDAIRHALASFYTACRYVDKADQAWPEDPIGREGFMNYFTEIFTFRVQLQAAKAGVDIHPETEMWLKNYVEPCWEESVSSIGEDFHDIHRAQSHNESMG